jgi:hypothetical protein
VVELAVGPTLLGLPIKIRAERKLSLGVSDDLIEIKEDIDAFQIGGGTFPMLNSTDQAKSDFIHPR